MSLGSSDTGTLPFFCADWCPSVTGDILTDFLQQGQLLCPSRMALLLQVAAHEAYYKYISVTCSNP